VLQGDQVLVVLMVLVERGGIVGCAAQIR